MTVLLNMFVTFCSQRESRIKVLTHDRAEDTINKWILAEEGLLKSAEHTSYTSQSESYSRDHALWPLDQGESFGQWLVRMPLTQKSGSNPLGPFANLTHSHGGWVRISDPGLRIKQVHMMNEWMRLIQFHEVWSELDQSDKSKSLFLISIWCPSSQVSGSSRSLELW